MWSGQLAFDELEVSDDFDDLDDFDDSDVDDLESVELDEEESPLDDVPSVGEVVAEEEPRVSVT